MLLIWILFIASLSILKLTITLSMTDKTILAEFLLFQKCSFGIKIKFLDRWEEECKIALNSLAGAISEDRGKFWHLQ